MNSPIAESGEYLVESETQARTALTMWNSKIELSEKFFNEIIRHPVPIDMNTLTALKRCSLGLDLYLWLVYRTFPLSRTSAAAHLEVSCTISSGLRPLQSNAVTHDDCPKLPSPSILRELKKIKLAWKELKLLHGSGRPDPASLRPRRFHRWNRRHGWPDSSQEAPGVERHTQGGDASGERRDDPSSMGKKPTTHIVDADREIPATFDSAAKFSLCGVFLYMSEQVDNADPSCQKCLRYRHSRRRMKGRTAPKAD